MTRRYNFPEKQQGRQMKVSYLSISGETSLKSAALRRVRASKASAGDKKVLRVGGRLMMAPHLPAAGERRERTSVRRVFSSICPRGLIPIYSCCTEQTTWHARQLHFPTSSAISHSHDKTSACRRIETCWQLWAEAVATSQILLSSLDSLLPHPH